MTEQTHPMFDLGNEWNLKPGVKRLDTQVFFRGMGGDMDTILVLVKLASAGIKCHQYVMFDGEKFDDDDKRLCSGEAGIGITTHFLPEDTTYVDKIYQVLTDFVTDPLIDNTHWLNQLDQYSKIQIRHRIDGGEWSKWYDKLAEAA